METTRNKRLEELFADEPHLSPTMMARRLHEKLEAAQAGKAGRVPVVPPLPASAARSEAQAVSLTRAANILRAGADGATPTDAATARLFRFRETTLARWLADAPELRRDSPMSSRRATL